MPLARMLPPTSFLITFVLLDFQGLFLSWANRSLLETKACSLPMHTIHPTMCLWHVLAHVFEHLQVRVMSSAEKKGGLGNTKETREYERKWSGTSHGFDNRISLHLDGTHFEMGPE